MLDPCHAKWRRFQTNQHPLLCTKQHGDKNKIPIYGHTSHTTLVKSGAFLHGTIKAPPCCSRPLPRLSSANLPSRSPFLWATRVDVLPCFCCWCFLRRRCACTIVARWYTHWTELCCYFASQAVSKAPPCCFRPLHSERDGGALSFASSYSSCRSGRVAMIVLSVNPPLTPATVSSWRVGTRIVFSQLEKPA